MRFTSLPSHSLSHEYSPEIKKYPKIKRPSIERYVEKFEHTREDLENLFNIEVTSVTSLRYSWVLDEFYEAVVKELLLGTPFALDYFLEEKLLTKEDIEKRGVTSEMKEAAMKVLETYSGPRFTRAKALFEASGILR